MIDRKTLKMAWSILDRKERRNAWIVLATVVISAMATSIMVASIMPFLAVLAEPSRIHEIAILDRAYTAGNFGDSQSFLIALGLASICVILLANAVQILRVYVVTRYAFMRAHTISVRLLSSYLRQPYSYFLANHSGELGTKVLSESQQIVVQFFRPATEACAAIFTLIALLVLLLYVDPAVTVVVFLVFGGIYGGTLFITRGLIQNLGEKRAVANSARFKIANEALGGARDIKLLGREWSYLERYAEPSLRMGKSMASVAAIGHIPQYIMHATAFSGMIVLCLVLLGDPTLHSRDAMADILPTIGLLAFAGQRMMPELSKLFQSLTMLVYSDSAVRTVYHDLVTHQGTERLPRERATPLGLKHELAFKDIHYRYNSNGKAGLCDVSFRIRVGERIGIVGTTGAGKSTLANILLGLISPTEGHFVVDGTEITPANLRAWQRSLGYVPQEIFLIDATIRENIAFGVPLAEIDQSRILEAARIAQVHEFIVTELEQGYDTEVGERGIRLSGGQRQRIGIARALYNEADLIVLDEATSALDNVTEKEVMRSIDALPGDKTLVIIAHRLSTLRGCDRIIVLDEGRISAIGTWEELENESHVFRSFAKSVGKGNAENSSF